MKYSIRTIAIALALAPAAAFAQSYSQPQEGYTPSKTQYPSDMQGAQSTTGGQRSMNMQSDSGYGGAVGGATQSGSSYRIMPHNSYRSMYEHH